MVYLSAESCMHAPAALENADKEIDTLDDKLGQWFNSVLLLS